jgi:hypothetical protein
MGAKAPQGRGLNDVGNGTSFGIYHCGPKGGPGTGTDQLGGGQGGGWSPGG